MDQLNVIVIDDSEIDRYILSRQLKAAGVVRIDQFSSALEAIEYLQSLDASATESAPDLIILDVNMPKMNGFEFLQATQDMLGAKPLINCKIVMYSAADQHEEQTKTSEYASVKGFLPKGSTPEEVQNLLSRLF